MTGNKHSKTQSHKALKRSDIARQVHTETGLSTQQSKDLVSQLFYHISDALTEGEVVKLAGFGTFNVRQKAARMGRNPKTGVECLIQPRKVITFKPSSFMKERVEQGHKAACEPVSPKLAPKAIRRTQPLRHEEWTSLFELLGIFVFLQPQAHQKKFDVAVETIVELKSVIEPKASLTKRTVSSWLTLNKARLLKLVRSGAQAARVEALLSQLQFVEHKRDIIFSMLDVAIASGEYTNEDRSLIVHAILFWGMTAKVVKDIEGTYPDIAIEVRKMVTS